MLGTWDFIRSPDLRGPLLAVGAFAVGVGSLGCGEAEVEAVEVAEVPTPAGAVAEAPAEAVVEEPRFPNLTAEEGRDGEAIGVGPGFRPDPLTRRGTTTGGPLTAQMIDERCTGFIGATPDHVFEAAGTFAELTMMAASTADTTLTVVDPAGEAHCSDDAEELHPMVRLRVTAGTYRVWVGVTDEGTAAPYVFGVSELDDSRPSRLLTQP